MKTVIIKSMKTTWAASRLSAAVALCAVLSACGGGSDSAVNMIPAPPPPPPPPQFTSFSSVQASTPTTVNGNGREGSLVVSADGSIPPSGISTPTETAGTVTFSINGSKQITAISIAGGQSSVSFDSTNATSSPLLVNGKAVATAITNSTGSNQALYADPYALGFNYQSFGVWASGLVKGATAKYGVISVGAKTNVANVPTSGAATFVGFAGGIYANPNGSAYRYAASASFAVDFGARSVGLVTSNDTITNIATNATSGVSTPITAAMTYGSGSSTFSGPFQAGTFLAGTGSGTFYGPNANELGGTFSISGSAGTLVGGFGGVR